VAEGRKAGRGSGMAAGDGCRGDIGLNLPGGHRLAAGVGGAGGRAAACPAAVPSLLPSARARGGWADLRGVVAASAPGGSAIPASFSTLLSQRRNALECSASTREKAGGNIFSVAVHYACLPAARRRGGRRERACICASLLQPYRRRGCSTREGRLRALFSALWV